MCLGVPSGSGIRALIATKAASRSMEPKLSLLCRGCRGTDTGKGDSISQSGSCARSTKAKTSAWSMFLIALLVSVRLACSLAAPNPGGGRMDRTDEGRWLEGGAESRWWEEGDWPEHGRAQRQDSLTDQMAGLLKHAEREGMYDAADWIKARWRAGWDEDRMIPQGGLPRGDDWKDPQGSGWKGD